MSEVKDYPPIFLDPETQNLLIESEMWRRVILGTPRNLFTAVCGKCHSADVEETLLQRLTCNGCGNSYRDMSRS